MSEPRVFYEDNHLLVLIKPVGWLVQGDKTGDRTLTDWGKQYIKTNYNKPGEVFLHPTHRIDRPVSGLVLFARTSKALARINEAFKDNRVFKTYLAVVKGVPGNTQGTLVDWLWKDVEKNISKSVAESTTNTKRSELWYTTLASQGGLSLLKVKPRTGRPHQIRVQLSNLGHPIVGDLKYGYENANADKGILLHAYGLEFLHPVKKSMLNWHSRPEWTSFKSEINELDSKNQG